MVDRACGLPDGASAPPRFCESGKPNLLADVGDALDSPGIDEWLVIGEVG